MSSGRRCRRPNHFVNYHCVLNRPRWSGRHAAYLLLGLLIDAFVPAGPVILGIDNTIERRGSRPLRAHSGRWAPSMLTVPAESCGTTPSTGDP
jgi:hypothetical protein